MMHDMMPVCTYVFVLNISIQSKAYRLKMNDGNFLEETTMIYVIPVDERLHDIWHCVSYYFDSIRYDTSVHIIHTSNK
jgi:hypothetical protein